MRGSKPAPGPTSGSLRGAPPQGLKSLQDRAAGAAVGVADLRSDRLRIAGSPFEPLAQEASLRSLALDLLDDPARAGARFQEWIQAGADILVAPITPEILSAREFRDGTMELLDRLEPSSAMGATLGPMKAVIYRQDRTIDAKVIAAGIREDFIKLKGRVTVLDTAVPHAKAYKEAATLRIPVHRHEQRREGVTPSAYSVMHALAWELIPSLRGLYADAGNHRRSVA